MTRSFDHDKWAEEKTSKKEVLLKAFENQDQQKIRSILFGRDGLNPFLSDRFKKKFNIDDRIGNYIYFEFYTNTHCIKSGARELKRSWSDLVAFNKKATNLSDSTLGCVIIIGERVNIEKLVKIFEEISISHDSWFDTLHFTTSAEARVDISDFLNYLT